MQSQSYTAPRQIIRPKVRMRQSTREAWVAIAFLLPNLLLFLIFTLWPTIFSFGVGFTTWNGIGFPQWTGLQNYVALLNDALFRKSLFNTALYTVEFVPLVLICSIGLALLFN